MGLDMVVRKFDVNSLGIFVSFIYISMYYQGEGYGKGLLQGTGGLQ